MQRFPVRSKRENEDAFAVAISLMVGVRRRMTSAIVSTTLLSTAFFCVRHLKALNDKTEAILL